ncbi:MAG: GDSL-type esterase/lipase family protein [Pseudomonadales bacterium]|nr:GDSL-type esterase/lipase family protein [Pseudomonadales bacterium]
MSQTLPINNKNNKAPSNAMAATATHPDTLPNSISWVKKIGYSLLVLLGLIILWSFVAWAQGSYRVLSDDPTVWQNSIDQLSQQDISRILDPEKTTTLFVGSSSIRLFQDLENVFAQTNIIKKGFGGAKINDLAYYKESLIFNQSPQLMVIYIGINDILYRDYENTQELTADLFLLLDDIQQKFGHVPIALVALRPIAKPKLRQKIADFNFELSRYAISHPQVHFVDPNDRLLTPSGELNQHLLHWDGFHLNQAGYQTWGTAIRDKLIDLKLLI